MAQVLEDDGTPYPITVDVVIVGGGAAGLVTALAASDRGLGVLVIERDAVPRGSTSLSAGLIPAAGTRYQRAAGIQDSVDLFATDILRKAHGEPHLDQVNLLASTIGPAVEWLGEKHRLQFSVIDNFSYPGHSAMRMHGLPTRSGEELMDRLRAAAETAEIDILTSSIVDTIVRRGGLITGVVVGRGGGARERIGCGSLVLACNGFGGNPDLVRRYIPEIAGALYFGHPGNQGDAVLWGDQLGAATRHLSGYQGHGSVAHPHGILITWATITEGGFQVNADGRRFANEARGYSEAAAAVIAEPGALAWTIFDERIATIAAQFEDFRSARSHNAIVTAATIDELAERTRSAAGCGPRILRERFRSKDAGCDRHIRPRLGRRCAASSTVFSGSCDGRSLPHARWLVRGRERARTWKRWQPISKPLRSRWCSLWRVGIKCVGLPFRQWAPHRSWLRLYRGSISAQSTNEAGRRLT